MKSVIAEDWRGGIGAGWVPFGEPPPFVAKVERGFAQRLLPLGREHHQERPWLCPCFRLGSRARDVFFDHDMRVHTAHTE